jgi:hypothetical protein
LAKAANRILQIESGEVLAETALTDAGAAGLEVEVFLYDTLQESWLRSTIGGER